MAQPEEKAASGGNSEEEEPSLLRRTVVESRKLWRIAGPAMLTRLALNGMNVVTQAFVGHLGDLQLASVAIAINVIVGFNFGLMLGMASALETLCGQAFGARKHRMLGVYLQRSFIVMFIFGVLLLPLYIFATPILRLVGQEEEIARLAGSLSVWFIPQHFAFVFLFTLQRFLQCQMKNIVILPITAVAFAAHCFLSWLLIIRLDFGLVGAAVALNVAWWIPVVGLFLYTVCAAAALSRGRASPSEHLPASGSSSSVAVGSGWQAFVAYINVGCYYFIGVPLGALLCWAFKLGVLGLWSGMIGGTAVQTLVLGTIVIRCDWEKEAQKARTRVKKWSIPKPQATELTEAEHPEPPVEQAQASTAKA
ncbi:unnamed protein product [Victoria cruziana]